MGNVHKNSVREIKIWKREASKGEENTWRPGLGGEEGCTAPGGERRAQEVEERVAMNLLDRWTSGRRPTPGGVAG
jgi:hypothetical protein